MTASRDMSSKENDYTTDDEVFFDHCESTLPTKMDMFTIRDRLHKARDAVLAERRVTPDDKCVSKKVLSHLRRALETYGNLGHNVSTRTVRMKRRPSPRKRESIASTKRSCVDFVLHHRILILLYKYL